MKGNLYAIPLNMISKKIYTLVFLRKENQLLLGLKKRGFGINKWNGFGGKVEPKETILEAAVRELKEECCMNVKSSDLKNLAHLEFTFEGNPVMMDVRVFATSVFEGNPQETEEMRPKWFKYDEIPYEDMWLDDKIWLPYLIKEKPIVGKFHYEGFEKILQYTLKEVTSMEDFYMSQNCR